MAKRKPTKKKTRKKKKTPREQKLGAPPGSLVYVGEEPSQPQSIHLVDFNSEGIEEKDLSDPEDCAGYEKSQTVTWINVTGLHKVDTIDRIGKLYGLHPLHIEDILNTEHRPKFEDQEEYIFLTLKMLSLTQDEEKVEIEQISLVLGKNFVLSFQEEEGDVFDPIRTRIRNQKGLIRKYGADYLFYSLIDAIVDNYFIVIENIDSRTSKMEEWILSAPKDDAIEHIQSLKKESIFHRKALLPLREAIGSLLTSESNLIHQNNLRYFKDVSDHIVSIIGSLETQREMITGLMDIHMSMLSNRMNAIMKVLTIMASIFIPLTFIAGIYGMNFKYMPELETTWGYPTILAIMFVLGGGMALYFWKKKWM